MPTSERATSSGASNAPARASRSTRDTARSATASGASRAVRPARSPRTTPPVLVRQVRAGIVESEHRGHIVEVDSTGRIVRIVGDPERVVTLRSTVKPFGVVALLEAGGREAFDLSPAEIAILASSHSGEDLHVRTLQGLYRRAGVSQTSLACGTEGMPLDALTAARLARDGERPSPIRHMCSGQHSVFILLARLGGWPVDGYWEPEHPAQVAYRAAVGRAFSVAPASFVTAIDGCGVLTYAVPLREVARAYAFLADPTTVALTDPRAAVARPLTTVRDAMLAHPEMVAGSRDRLDTSLMKAVPGRVVSKAGMEALRGVAILGRAANGGAANGGGRRASGLALKIEDGDGYERGLWAATVEALRQVGVVGGESLRALARYHRPVALDPHGRVVAEAIPDFELTPVGELVG